MTKRDLQLIEPVPIDDDLCTALAEIEDAGLGARFILYSEQTSFECGREVVNVVKRKIVLPIDAIAPAIELTLEFLVRRLGAHARQKLLRLLL